MKSVATIQTAMRCNGKVVARRNRRGDWFSMVKTTGRQEEII